MGTNRPHVYRLDELACKAIKYIIEEDDVYGKEFIMDELELTDEEMKYFDIDKSDLVDEDEDDVDWDCMRQQDIQDGWERE